MAEQATQVFYIQDLQDSRWSVVPQGRTNRFNLQKHDATLGICETHSFSTQFPSRIEEQVVDDVLADRTDHDEDLWENILT